VRVGAARRATWLRHRLPEILLVLFGIALRVSMLRSFPPQEGYDFEYHWEYVAWFARHGTLPPLELREAFHPPLFYVLAGWLVRWGSGPEGVQLVSVVCGGLRTVLLWAGLELYVPGSRLARIVALALAAVVPASVHIDGMVSGESLFSLLVLVALLLAPQVFRAAGPRRHAFAALSGLVLGLAVLTKASGLTVLGAVALPVLAQLVVGGEGWRGRARRLAPWCVAFVAFAMTSGWYFVRNQAHYGKPVLTSFDGWEAFYMVAYRDMPIIFRRPPEFVVGWSPEIYDAPVYPSAALSRSRFFPILVASTFADYYNYSFAPRRPDLPSVTAALKPMPAEALALARASVAGGTVVALVTLLAWCAMGVASVRARAYDGALLLLVPLIAVLAQLGFAIVYPYDLLGVVKGAYLQFASPPLAAVFGIGTAWLAGRGRLRLLAALPITALATVAAYTIYCRAL
jgi:hypothetical protein